MDSESYWIKRAEEREQEWNNTSKNTIEKELAKYYQQALFSIEDDIAILYGKYAKDNNLTYAEASKMLASNEFKQWKMSMEDYLNAITDSKDNKLLLELNTLVMRKRISRLDKLYGDTLKNLYTLGSEAEKSITNFLSGVYKDNYYENIFDIGKSISIKKSAIEVDNKKVGKVLNSSWSGKNYSQRIWKNTDNLAKLIKNEITNGVHRGVSIQKMSSLIQERMNVGKYEATRLVRTEMNYVQNQASLDSIKEADMKYFMFLATLDKRTSNKCREHDRKVYPIDEAQAGSNMPPLHPHCRSTIAGNLTDYDTGRGKRTAKNKDGKRIIIPAAMKYDDYYKIYIEESMSFSEWEKANKKPKAKKNDIIKTGNYNNPIAKAIDKKHYDKLYEILNKSTEKNAKDVWVKLESKINIDTVHGRPNGAYASSKGINLNIDFVAQGNTIKQPYQTLYHEGGHVLDLYLGHYFGYEIPYISFGYKNGAFIKALKDDVETLVKNRDKQLKLEFKKRLINNELDWFKQNGYLGIWHDKIPSNFKYRKEFAYKSIEKELREIPKINRGNVSDIFQGATKAKIDAGIGHGGATYWKQRTYNGIEWGLGTEAFAEFMDSMLANSGSLEQMKKYLPTAYKIINEILEFILNEVN